MSKQFSYISFVCLAFLCANSPAHASVIAYEGFDYGASSSTLVGKSGGTGFTGAWTQGGFNVSAAPYMTGGTSLAYDGLATSGGSVSTAASGGPIDGAVRSLASSLGTANTTVYLSFVVEPLGTVGASDYFGLNLDGSTGSELFIGKPGGGASTQYVMETRGGTGQVASDTPVIAGQTTLLVVKAQFFSGADTFTLYVDPTPGGTEPLTGVVKSNLDLGTVSSIGLYSDGAFALDEIRIGTTYADVTPAPEPMTLFLVATALLGLFTVRRASARFVSHRASSMEVVRAHRGGVAEL